MVRADAPLRVRSVVIEGNKRTDPSVIEDELQDAYRATTVEGVHRGLLRASHNLEGLGIFKSVEIQMQQTPTKARGETDLVITVAEKGVVSAYTGTSFTRDDVGVDASGSLRNPTGHAETLTASYAHSRLGSRSLRASLTKPRLRGADVRFMAEVHEDTVNHERTSSLREKVQAVAFHLATHSHRHRLSYELALRDVLPRRHLTVPYAYDASLSIMREAQPSLKSSLRYKFVDDRRDHPLLPSQGTYFSTLAEVAGLAFGDTAYVKAEVAGSAHRRLFGTGLSAHLGGTVGVVRPMPWRMKEDDGGYAAEPTTRFSDRYMMGGLQTLRGFGYTGVGPRASPREGGCMKGDSLGGDVKCTATAAVSCPLPVPLLDSLGLRAHVFADAGNLLPWSAPMEDLLKDMRLSAGAGLALTIGMARVELNYAKPIRRVAGKDFEQQWQFGLAAVYNP